MKIKIPQLYNWNNYWVIISMCFIFFSCCHSYMEELIQNYLNCIIDIITELLLWCFDVFLMLSFVRHRAHILCYGIKYLDLTWMSEYGHWTISHNNHKGWPKITVFTSPDMWGGLSYEVPAQSKLGEHSAAVLANPCYACEFLWMY